MRLWLLLTLAVFLTGCATAHEWWRPDGDYARFESDRYACLRDATHPTVTGAGGFVIGGTDVDNALMIECMRVKGYALRRKL